MKKENRFLKILAIILAVILALSIIGVCILHFVIIPHYADQLSASGHENFAQFIEDNNNLSSYASYAKLFSNKDFVDFLSKMDNDTAGSILSVLNTMNEEEMKASNIKDENANDKNIDKTGTTAYERISEAASPEEIAEGIAIISKLDMSYVLSLTKDGLTPEEKAELLAYVRSVLTPDEISKALALYRAYKQYL